MRGRLTAVKRVRRGSVLSVSRIRCLMSKMGFSFCTYSGCSPIDRPIRCLGGLQLTSMGSVNTVGVRIVLHEDGFHSCCSVCSVLGSNMLIGSLVSLTLACSKRGLGSGGLLTVLAGKSHFVESTRFRRLRPACSMATRRVRNCVGSYLLWVTTVFL